MDENGQPQYTELMTNNPDGDTFKTCQLLYTMVMVPTVVDTRSSYGLYSDAQLEAQSIWSSNIDDAYVLPEITMTEDESTELSSIYSDLSTLISEKLIKFIIGDEPLSQWDSFVEALKSMDAERCVEIYQTALDRYLQR
jgi:putative aldouronate transport system substrate-binding protein